MDAIHATHVIQVAQETNVAVIITADVEAAYNIKQRVAVRLLGLTAIFLCKNKLQCALFV